MQVPLLDLKAQYAAIRDEVEPAIQAVIDSQYFINGPAVRQLEAAVADYCSCAAAVGVSSGTDALLCSLMALGIGPGDEVITTPYTFFATVGSIARVGAQPVFVDIQPDTFNMAPAGLADAVTDRTRAIMPIHLFGQVAEMDPILAVAGDRGLAVIEDAAQAIGATHRGRRAGAMGTVGCFSFFPSKNLGAFGDAGMIVTNDRELAGRLAVFRNHGGKDKYHNDFVGGNFRLDTLQAAVLLAKLPHLDDWSAGRRANAARYDELLAGCGGVVTPTVREGNVSIFNQYVIRAARRDDLQAFLAGAGIGTAIYYPLGLHQQACFADLGYSAGDFPETEKAAAEALALPIYAELTDEQIEYTAGKVRQFYG